VVLGPDGTKVARALAPDGRCPSLSLEGADGRTRALPSTPRGAVDEAFPVTVCEAAVPSDARTASIGEQRLPLPPTRAERIVVFGDTGCRMKEKTFQDCADPKAWPFARIASSAAAWKPDLVLHVGDFLYRKTPCPEGNAGCAGSPVGDRFATWDADFLAPAAPLLRAAPWVMVRGNHEGCSNGGEGWFRLLEPRALPASCGDATEPYAVTVGDLRLWVVDSVDADDTEAKPDKVARFQKQLAALSSEQAAAGVATWLLVHRPVFGIFGAPRGGAAASSASAAIPIVPINATLQAAWAASSPRAVDLVLSGHVHLFESLSFDAAASAARPAQLVAGMGGTLPDAAAKADLAGVVEQGVKVDKGLAHSQLGFVTMERQGADWSLSLRDPEGVAVIACTLQKRALTCARR
jgi:predicted phosphodiesterase